MRPSAALLCTLALLAGALPLSAAGAGGLAAGTPAPALGVTKTYNVPGDKVFDLADVKGKVVLVDFWATWCGPCVASIPHLQKTWEKYKDRQLVVIGHTDGSSKNLPAFIKGKGMTYPVTVGASLGDAYGVKGIPHVYLIDHEGKVAWHGHPAQLKDEQIDALLAKVPATK